MASYNAEASLTDQHRKSGAETKHSTAQQKLRQSQKRTGTRNHMQDAINFLMLTCASLAALAFGVLSAYGVCRAAFAAIRIHARSVAAHAEQPEAQTEPQTASL